MSTKANVKKNKFIDLQFIYLQAPRRRVNVDTLVSCVKYKQPAIIEYFIFKQLIYMRRRRHYCSELLPLDTHRYYLPVRRAKDTGR